MSVYLLATLDTKGAEAEFVRNVLRQEGVDVKVIDTGCIGTPSFKGDITREEVFRAAGESLDELVKANDRGRAVTAAAEGVKRLIAELHQKKQVDGVIGLGGSAGTTISASAMRALPLGVPKVLVSTLASGQTRHYVGNKDIMLVNSVVDIAGVNRVSRPILANAARAMAGMAKGKTEAGAGDDKPLVAATMFGVTTPCITRAREVLEAAGYEVLVFHATGTGGSAMESLVEDGLLAGVLDITTTELADEVVGGVFTAGPDRLNAAARAGVPQVVSVGATDMVNFHARDTVPQQFLQRNLYQHNPTVTLMRTTADENAKIGEWIGRSVSQAKGPVTVFLPTKGVSAIDRDGQPFNDPAARKVLFDSLRRAAGKTEIIELDQHINDTEFAEAAANKLLSMMRAKAK